MKQLNSICIKCYNFDRSYIKLVCSAVSCCALNKRMCATCACVGAFNTLANKESEFESLMMRPVLANCSPLGFLLDSVCGYHHHPPPAQPHSTKVYFIIDVHMYACHCYCYWNCLFACSNKLYTHIQQMTPIRAHLHSHTQTNYRQLQLSY